MKLIKEKGKYSGYNLILTIGKKCDSSFFEVPSESIDYASKKYIQERFPLINTNKRVEQFKELYKNLWLEVTEEQLNDMKHALGLDRGKKPYRNRFYSESNNPEWDSLVNKHLADKIEEQPNRTSYWLTEQGVEYVLGKSISDKYYKEL